MSPDRVAIGDRNVIRIGIICARFFASHLSLSLSFSTRFPNEVSEALFSEDVEQPADIGLSKNVEQTNVRTNPARHSRF